LFSWAFWHIKDSGSRGSPELWREFRTMLFRLARSAVVALALAMVWAGWWVIF
jgi:hypothetical protein